MSVMMAIMSLVMLVPLALVVLIVRPGYPAGGTPSLLMEMFVIFLMVGIVPIFFLVFGYLMTCLWIAIYNRITPAIGGIEFETFG